MRLEVRNLLQADLSYRRQVLFVAESEEESKIMESLGNPGDKIQAELALSLHPKAVIIRPEP